MEQEAVAKKRIADYTEAAATGTRKPLQRNRWQRKNAEDGDVHRGSGDAHRNSSCFSLN